MNNQVLCRPSGGGPRLDRWARIQSGGVNFGVFSTSRFVPSALSSDFLTTLYFSPTLLHILLTFCLLFRTLSVLFSYFVSLFPYFFIIFSVLFPFFPLFFAKLKIHFLKNQKLKKKKFAGTCNSQRTFLVTMFKQRNCYR